MVVFGSFRIIFERVGGARYKEGPAHSGARVIRRDLAMARGADLRIDVSVFRTAQDSFGPPARQAQQQHNRETGERRHQTLILRRFSSRLAVKASLPEFIVYGVRQISQDESVYVLSSKTIDSQFSLVITFYPV